jgi:uncharacterized OB-fold protein
VIYLDELRGWVGEASDGTLWFRPELLPGDCPVCGYGTTAPSAKCRSCGAEIPAKEQQAV